MSDSGISRLLQISIPAALAAATEAELSQVYSLGDMGREISELIKRMNGFYALESALHCFPASSSEEHSIFQWNDEGLWRSAYGEKAQDLYFFAENVFGEQFCIQDDEIHIFDPETGVTKKCCDHIDEWADLMLGEEGNYYTGFSLGHEWQIANGPLERGRRLVPKLPFVCRGPYEVSNLFSLDSVQGMLYREELAKKIEGVPDGTEISFYTF